MSPITVEQLLVGWSRTSNGKNVLARSPDWPSPPSRGEWVAMLGDFLDDDVDRIVHRTGESPWLLEFLPSEHGSILMAKAYATDSRRAGEFQVHALLDPTRTLGPQHLNALADAGVLLIERQDVTRLDSLAVEVPTIERSRNVRDVGLVLRSLHRGEPLVLRAADFDEAARLLERVAVALPESMGRGTPARSVATDALQATGIAIAVEPWSRGAEEFPFIDESRVGEPYERLARRIVAAEWEWPEDPRDIVDLAWLDWLSSGRGLGKGLRAAIDAEGFSDRFARVLDRLPHEDVDRALSQLGRWPEDRLGVLAEALIRCEDAIPDMVIQTLDRLPAEEVRRIVQRHWPELGHQLGLPAAVVQALKPARNWFGLAGQSAR